MKITLSVLCLMLSGCASVVSGTSQDIRVETEPSGGDCQLLNDRGSWLILSAPGVVSVHRSKGDLIVECHKGILKGSGRLHVDGTSDRKIWSALGGGLISLSVDKSSGAAYAYPEVIHVELK